MSIQSKNPKFAFIAGILLILLTLPACPKMQFSTTREKIIWQTLAQGKAKAASLHLPSLVDFYYGPQCPRCSAFDRKIYNDPDIISRINNQFVAIRIDLRYPLNPEEQALSDTMQTDGECMLMFLNSEGAVVKTEHGAPICSMDELSTAEFNSYLDQALSNLTGP